MSIETLRLAALRDMAVMDTQPEAGFDRLTSLAAALFDAPIALVSLLDQDRQWFKSRVGLDAAETPRAWAFCDHAIAQGPNSVFVVPNAADDARFVENPLVTGDPNIRFYAGAVLTTEAGHNLGTLCVIDQQPRQPTDSDLAKLQMLARMVVDQLELGRTRRVMGERQRLLEMAEAMSGVGHWRLEAESGRITWSDEVYRIHGLDRKSFDPNLGDGVASYHPDDQAAVAEFIDRALTAGEDFAFQLRLLRADGELRNVICKATCERDGKGRTSAVFGVFQDVTDQVRVLQAMARSEARFRHLAENAIDLVIEMDWNGDFTYVSPAVEHITGFTAAEVVGKPADNLMHPDDRERVHAEFVAQYRGPPGWRLEYRMVRKDGRVIWIEARPTIVRDPVSRKYLCVTDVIRDITERKLTEQALAKSEKRYRLLADNASDMISRVKPNGEITIVTPGCRKTLGYEPEELIGRRTVDMMHPDDKPGVVAFYEELISRGPDAVSAPFQFRAQHKDGHWVWLEGQPKIFFDSDTGAFAAIQDVVRDITKRKALETDLRHARAAAEAAAAVKGEFLANMSHELRTPLTSILGFSKLLGGLPNLGADGQRFVQRVSDASQALLTTVNDILDFSKLEAGQVEIEPRPVNPTALVESALELLAPQADAKGLYRRVVCENLPAEVSADDTRIRQILLNFISNAVKFTASGGVTVAARYDAASERLRCEVSDTGPGVPADRLDRLFKRFSQVDASTTRSHGGTGLGLAICKGLAEAMGGEVGVASVLGEGSTFWIEVPCPLIAAEPAPAPAGRAEADGIGGLRMLVADDNAMNRELVRIFLSPFGVEITEAANGVEAMRIAAAAPFDLILMDVRMPDVDGPTAAQAIRDGEGPNGDSPIIAFTAEAHDRQLPTAWTAIFDDQLPKPIIAADLIAIVEAWSPANIADRGADTPAVRRA